MFIEAVQYGRCACYISNFCNYQVCMNYIISNKSIGAVSETRVRRTLETINVSDLSYGVLFYYLNFCYYHCY